MKKILLGGLCMAQVICFICVYIIKKMAGVYAWNISLFILSPLALICALIVIIIVVVRLYKKKSIKLEIIFIVIFLILAYPLTIVMGLSNITYPTNESTKDEILISMPVKNPVLFGGKDYKVHAIWPSERYAYDILSKPYDIKSDDLDSYGIYNADVVAPVSGIVIDLKNSEEDIPPNVEEFKSLLGNYIFIKIDSTNTYLILAHLKQNSITVAVGDQIKEGEYIGKVGNSGTTSEPHLHIQHQRNNPMKMIYPTLSEGLPIKFKNQ